MIRQRFSVALAAVGLILGATTGVSQASDTPLTVVAGASDAAGEAYGEILVAMEVEIYTDPADGIRHFVGNRFSAGGRDGPLGSFAVSEATPPDCGNTGLSFNPGPKQDFFVAYSEPAAFARLEPAPTLRDAVVTSAQFPIRAAGGKGEIVAYAIWRFTPPGAETALVFTTIRTPNYRNDSWGNPDGFDAIVLFRENGGILSVLDSKVWRAAPDSLSMEMDAMAVAINPSTKGTELFVRYRSFEYNEYVSYDITDGMLDPRLDSECSM
jgi:hypothetical protein